LLEDMMEARQSHLHWFTILLTTDGRRSLTCQTKEPAREHSCEEHGVRVGGKDGRTLHNGECLDFSTTPEASKWDELPPMGSCRELFTLSVVPGSNLGDWRLWLRPWLYISVSHVHRGVRLELQAVECNDTNAQEKSRAWGMCSNESLVCHWRHNRIPYDSSEVYDTITDSWADLPPMPIPRSGIGTVFVEGKIFAMGGISKQREVVKTGNAYDPEKEEWIEIPAMEQIRALHCLITLQ